MTWPSIIPIGQTEAACPACGTVLSSKPERKTECPHCSQAILARTRPTGEQVLVTQEQAEIIKAQYGLTSGMRVALRFDVKDLRGAKEWETTQAELAKKFQAQPSDHDICWRILNRRLIEHSRVQDWGLYRNVRLDMAGILFNEGKNSDALSTLFEVCYLDINGCENRGGTPKELLKEYPPFDPRMGFTAPAVMASIRGLIVLQSLAEEETQALFMKIAAQLHANLKLPIAPEKAWATILKEISV